MGQEPTPEYSVYILPTPDSECGDALDQFMSVVRSQDAVVMADRYIIMHGPADARKYHPYEVWFDKEEQQWIIRYKRVTHPFSEGPYLNVAVDAVMGVVDLIWQDQ